MLDKITLGELVKELISIQIHHINIIKTTKIGALLSKFIQEDFKPFCSRISMSLHGHMRTC